MGDITIIISFHIFLEKNNLKLYSTIFNFFNFLNAVFVLVKVNFIFGVEIGIFFCTFWHLKGAIICNKIKFYDIRSLRDYNNRCPTTSDSITLSITLFENTPKKLYW